MKKNKSKKIMKKGKRFYKSLKMVRKECRKYITTREKVKFLFAAGIIDEHDNFVISHGIDMYYDEQFKKNYEKIKNNSTYGMLTSDNMASNVSNPNIENIDKQSIYPTQPVTAEMDNPVPVTAEMDNPVIDPITRAAKSAANMKKMLKMLEDYRRTFFKK